MMMMMRRRRRRRRYSDQNKEMIGGAYSTFGQWRMQEALTENLKVRDHLEDLGKDGSILRWVLMKYGMRV
jgi:hypothetical protein